MDLSEQAMIQEVLYLHSLWLQGPPPNPNPRHTHDHSLWHQGPPPNPNPRHTHDHSLWHQGPPPNPNPRHTLDHSLWHQGPPPNPNPRHTYNPSRSLHLSNPTSSAFRNLTHTNSTSKKIKKKKKKKKKSNLPPVSDIPWPCEEAVSDTISAVSGWPPFKSSSAAAAAARTTSPPEGLVKRATAELAQHNGLKACQGFFKSSAGSDNDDDGNDDDDDDDDVMEENDSGGGFEESVEFEFLLKLFTDNGELRSYYEKNFELGEFCCLVCGGTGQKVGKRFKDCVGLVQHSIAISKTKKMRAHRAYGHVICKVLGWNINRLPSIVLTKPGESQTVLEQSDAVGNMENPGEGVSEISRVNAKGIGNRLIN